MIRTFIVVHDVSILATLEDEKLLPILWCMPESLALVHPNRLIGMDFQDFCTVSKILIEHGSNIYIDADPKRRPPCARLPIDSLLSHYQDSSQSPFIDQKPYLLADPINGQMIVLAYDTKQAKEDYVLDKEGWFAEIDTLKAPEFMMLDDFKDHIRTEKFWNFSSYDLLTSKSKKRLSLPAQIDWTLQIAPGKGHTLFDETKLEEIANGLDLQPSDTREMLRKHLLAMAQLGPQRELVGMPHDLALQQLAARFPNFSEVVEAISNQVALARLTEDASLRLQPILLAGEPGIGKTAFSKALAEALNTTFFEIRMNGLSAGFAIGGHDLGWSNGRPGIIWEKMALGRVANPVGLLDEIDKVSGSDKYSPLAHLYALLETDTAKRFADEAIRLEIDVSRIVWLATANNINEIESPLLSRFTVYTVPAPTASQSRQIIKNVYAHLLRHAKYGSYFSPEIPEDVVEVVAGSSPRETAKVLLDALGRAANAKRSTLAPADINVACIAKSDKQRVGFV